MGLMTRHRYAIGYRDYERHKCELCAYAQDAFEARLIAVETHGFIRNHPNLIDYILPL